MQQAQLEEIERLQKITSDIREKFYLLPEQFNEVQQELEEEIRQKDNQIAQKEEELAKEKGKVKQKEEELAKAKEEIRQQETQIKLKEDAINQKDKQIEEKVGEINQQKKLLSSKETEIGKRDEGLGTLKSALKTKLDVIMHQYQTGHTELKKDLKEKVESHLVKSIESMNAIGGETALEKFTSLHKHWEGTIDNSLNAIIDLNNILGALGSDIVEQSINEAKGALA